MDTTVLDRYRKYRRETAVPARYALEWAKNDPAAVYPNIEWGSRFSGDAVIGRGTVGRYDVVVRVEVEDDPMLMGSFDNTWTEGAVQNPNWRPGAGNTLRWYHPMTTIAEHVRGLRDMGVARHDAFRLATSHVMADLKADVRPEQYVITVTASRKDVELGEAVVGGFDVPERNPEEHLIVCALDLVREAVSIAMDKEKDLISAGDYVDPDDTSNPANVYRHELAAMLDYFRFNLCENCGQDVDKHVFAPDPDGHPRQHCMPSDLTGWNPLDD